MKHSISFLLIGSARLLPASAIALIALSSAALAETQTSSPTGSESTIISTSASPVSIKTESNTVTTEPVKQIPTESTDSKNVTVLPKTTDGSLVQPTSVTTSTPISTPSTQVITQPSFPVANAPQVIYPTGVAYPTATPIQYFYPGQAPVQSVYPGTAVTPTSPTGNVSVNVVIGTPNQVGIPAAPSTPIPYPAGVLTPVFHPPGTAPHVFYPPNSPVFPGSVPSTVQPGVPYPGTVLVNQANNPWLQKLIEADRLYQMGQFALAEQLYREAIAAMPQNSGSVAQTGAITNPALLPAQAQLYWQQAIAAQSQRLDSQSVTYLRQLVQTYPQFIPAHLQLAQGLNALGRNDEAVAVLAEAIARYPNQVELARYQVDLLRRSNRWLEASIAARQFALTNPTSSLAQEFSKQADELLKQAQTTQTTKSKNGLLNTIFRGVVNRVLSGNSSSTSSLPSAVLQGVLGNRSSSTPTTSSTGKTIQTVLGVLDIFRSLNR